MTKQREQDILTTHLIADVFNREMMEEFVEIYKNENTPNPDSACVDVVKERLVNYLMLYDTSIATEIKLAALDPKKLQAIRTATKTKLAELDPLILEVIIIATLNMGFTFISAVREASENEANEGDAKEEKEALLKKYYNNFMRSRSKEPDKAKFMSALGEIAAKIEPGIAIPAEGPKWQPAEKATKIAATKAADVEQHFAERTTVKEVTLKSTRKKTEGISGGYIGKSKSDTSKRPQEYMIKFARKTEDSYVDPKTKLTVKRNDNSDARDFLCEFMMAPLYQRTLPNRSPVIAAVESTKDGFISMRSKFLPGSKTISAFTGGLKPSWWGPNAATKLAKVEGIEKLWAAYLSGGEEDIHLGNSVVMDGVSKNEKVFGKIDLGRSGQVMFTNGEAMWNNFNNRYRMYQYDKNVDFDVSKFSSALSQNAQISEDEIETYVKSRIHTLKKLGFNPQGLRIKYWVDDEYPNWDSRKKGQTKTLTTFDDLEKFYIKMYKKHWEAQQEFLKLVVAVEKMTDQAGDEPSPGWIKGEWIQLLNKENPIQYAIDNNLKIDGQDPMTYAVFHGIKINGKTPDVYAESNGINIGGLPPDAYTDLYLTATDPVFFAFSAGYKIDGEDPLKYAMLHGIKLNGEDPTLVLQSLYVESQDPVFLIDSKSAIEFAALNGIKVEGVDPIRYAYKNKWDIAGRDPITYAVLHDLKIEEVNGDKYSAIDYAIKHAIKVDDISPAKYAEIHGIETNNPVIPPSPTSPSPLPLKTTTSTVSNIPVSSPISSTAAPSATPTPPPSTTVESSDSMVLSSSSSSHQLPVASAKKTPAQAQASSEQIPVESPPPLPVASATKKAMVQVQVSSPLSPASSPPPPPIGSHTAALNKRRESITQQPLSVHEKAAKSSSGKHAASHEKLSHAEAEAAKKKRESLKTIE